MMMMMIDSHGRQGSDLRSLELSSRFCTLRLRLTFIVASQCPWGTINLPSPLAADHYLLSTVDGAQMSMARTRKPFALVAALHHHHHNHHETVPTRNTWAPSSSRPPKVQQQQRATSELDLRGENYNIAFGFASFIISLHDFENSVIFGHFLAKD